MEERLKGKSAGKGTQERKAREEKLVQTRPYKLGGCYAMVPSWLPHPLHEIENEIRFGCLCGYLSDSVIRCRVCDFVRTRMQESSRAGVSSGS